MKEVASESLPRNWHVAKYPLLAWIETLIKASAFVIAVIALERVIVCGTFFWPSGWRLAEFAVLGFLAIGLVGGIFDRIIEREVVAMIFIVFNNLAHWSMVASLVYLPDANPYVLPFCALMAAGDMVKTIFIKAHSFQVRNIPQFMLFGLTAVYVTGYLIILIMELFR